MIKRSNLLIIFIFCYLATSAQTSQYLAVWDDFNIIFFRGEAIEVDSCQITETTEITFEETDSTFESRVSQVISIENRWASLEIRMYFRELYGYVQYSEVPGIKVGELVRLDYNLVKDYPVVSIYAETERISFRSVYKL